MTSRKINHEVVKCVCVLECQWWIVIDSNEAIERHLWFHLWLCCCVSSFIRNVIFRGLMRISVFITVSGAVDHKSINSLDGLRYHILLCRYFVYIYCAVKNYEKIFSIDKPRREQGKVVQKHMKPETDSLRCVSCFVAGKLSCFHECRSMIIKVNLALIDLLFENVFYFYRHDRENGNCVFKYARN